MPNNRRALCVGINKFKNYASATLQGCVNDANDMSALLQKHLGFTGSDITLLKDEEATKANIMNNLKEMVAGAKEGKYAYLVFSLSSHGTQIPDLEHDEEEDQADEAFCPHDLAQKGNQWDRDFVIVDDELRDLFTQLPENVLLEVFLDTCHSGTGLKAIDHLLTRRPRYLPPPSLEGFLEVEKRRSRGLPELMNELGSVHHILWAGCKADQTSADAEIGGDWHGAFTYYFCQEVNASNNSLSREDLIAKVQKDLKDKEYPQIPQLECEATKRDLKVG